MCRTAQDRINPSLSAEERAACATVCLRGGDSAAADLHLQDSSGTQLIPGAVSHPVVPAAGGVVVL